MMSCTTATIQFPRHTCSKTQNTHLYLEKNIVTLSNALTSSLWLNNLFRQLKNHLGVNVPIGIMV